MTLFEFLLLLLVAAAIIFMLYYLLKGSKGKLDIRRPVESRVDEYLDRRFGDLISEWSLVTGPGLRSFKERADRQLSAEEQRIAALTSFEKKVSSDLDALEVRLDALEKEGSHSSPRKT